MNRLFLLIIIALLTKSCGTTKMVKKQPASKSESAIDLINIINNRSDKKNKSVFLKGRVEFSYSDTQASLNIIIKNYKDSLVWASLRGPFGIELIRAQISPDSVYIINHTSNKFSIKPISFLSFLPVLSESYFNDLQNIIMARPPIIKDEYNYIIEEDGFFLTSENNEYKISKSHTVESAYLNISPMFSVRYEFKDFDVECHFPKKQKIYLNEEELINLNYSTVKFNADFNTSFKIPSNYVKEE